MSECKRERERERVTRRGIEKMGDKQFTSLELSGNTTFLTVSLIPII